MGTFRSGGANTNLDFFVMGDSMATLVSQIFTVEDSRQKGYVPVQVGFVSQQTSHRTMGIRKPPAMLRHRITGPLQKQEGWELVMEAMKGAWEAAESDGDGNLQLKMDHAYASFANKAELAIAEATGTELPKEGCRATQPRAVWHSVLPEKVKEPSFPVSGTLHALRGALVQARRVHGHPRVWEEDLEIMEATELSLPCDLDGGGGRT